MSDLTYHGELHRGGIWGFYVSMEIISLYANISFLVAIARLKQKRTSTDVLIGGLCSGILAGIAECLPQCFTNMVYGNFALGPRACFVEAFCHIISLQIQFFSVGAIAYRTYIGIVKLQPFSQERAIKILIWIWTISCVGTGLFGGLSSYGLSTTGTFCFYGWKSLALLAWAWPTATISAGLMVFWYWKTFQTVKLARQGAKEILIDGSRKDAVIAMKLASLVCLFIGGYFLFVFLSFYELIWGSHKPGIEISAAVTGLIYWVSVPFVYGLTNSRLGFRSALLFNAYGSTTRRHDPKYTPESGALSRADTKVEMSGLVTAPVSSKKQETVSPEENEVDLSPRSNSQGEASLGSSRVALISEEQNNDGSLLTQHSGDGSESAHQSSLDQSESPRIFNPFVAQILAASDRSTPLTSANTANGISFQNEISPRSISVIGDPTPHYTQLTSVTGKPSFFADQEKELQTPT